MFAVVVVVIVNKETQFNSWKPKDDDCYSRMFIIAVFFLAVFHCTCGGSAMCHLHHCVLSLFPLT